MFLRILGKKTFADYLGTVNVGDSICLHKNGRPQKWEQQWSIGKDWRWTFWISLKYITKSFPGWTQQETNSLKNVKSLQPSKKATKLNKANDSHVAGYHTLSDQAHDKLSKQSGAKSTKGPS